MREFVEHDASPGRSELYRELAQCVRQLLTWLRLRSESACRGADQQEAVFIGDQVSAAGCWLAGCAFVQLSGCCDRVAC